MKRAGRLSKTRATCAARSRSRMWNWTNDGFHFVVPAKAGTHNPWRSWTQRDSATTMSTSPGTLAAGRMGPCFRRDDIERFARSLSTPGMTAYLSSKEKPRPVRETGRGLCVRSAAAATGQFVQAVNLLDHLNDTARTWVDQHGSAVHHRVAVGRDGIGLRHVVIGDAGFRQHAAHDHAIRNRVIRHALAHDIFAERRTLIDGDAIDVVIDDHVAATNHAGGDRALRLRRDWRADGARDRDNGKYPASHPQLLCDDARPLAPARNCIQFIAPSIVPRKGRSHTRPFLAFFACIGTRRSRARLLSGNRLSR